MHSIVGINLARLKLVTVPEAEISVPILSVCGGFVIFSHYCGNIPKRTLPTFSTIPSLLVSFLSRNSYLVFQRSGIHGLNIDACR